MNYWVITDTHFGHANCLEWCSRPKDFEERILSSIEALVKDGDILIHLGDVAFYNEEKWHRKLRCVTGSYNWLVRGNHDKRSDVWYLKKGWDFVGESILLRRYGKDILLSHKPQPECGFDVNIHGHFHNCEYKRREEELLDILTERHLLIKCEHDYKPYRLRKLVEIVNKRFV